MKNLLVGIIFGAAAGFTLGQFFEIVRTNELEDDELDERDTVINQLMFESLLCSQVGDLN